MSCPSTDPYKFNIKVRDTTIPFMINPLNDTNDKNLMNNKCRELGYPSPLTSDNLRFINQDMNSDTCFSDPSSTLKQFNNNCYLKKSCNPSGKTIDYYCEHSLPYNLESTVTIRNEPIPISSLSNMSNVMDGSDLTFSNSTGLIRCREGYVFKQLEHNFENDTEYATAMWVKRDPGNVWLIKPTHPPPNSIVKNQLSGECVPDKCKDMTVPDSSYSYDPLIGSHISDSEPITVRCNDGYIFNHDLLHQGGKVKCEYDLMKQGSNVWDTNSMSWYIHDERLESRCNQYKTEAACVGKDGLPTPTYNPYEYIQSISIERKQGLYDLELEYLDGRNNIEVGCQWSPPITSNRDGYEIRKEGKCSFRKKVDTRDKQVNLCQPIYCPEKSIPHSDKSGIGTYRPLPGPKNSKRKSKGECITTSEEVINVNSLEDCLCQQHMSCNSCSSDQNCQWCGSKDPNSTPGCYYTGTNEPICRNDAIKQGEGGSCMEIHENMIPVVRNGWLDRPVSERTISNCEDTFECINKETNRPIPSRSIHNDDLSLETISENYQRNTKSQPPIGRSLCLSYNNRWDDSANSSGTSNDDYCVFRKNKIINDSTYISAGQSSSIGLKKNNTDNTYYLSTEPQICKPTSDSGIDICPTHNSYDSCVGNTSCEWVDNYLSEYLINWSAGNGGGEYKDIIKLQPISGKKCYLCPNSGKYIATSSPTSTSGSQCLDMSNISTPSHNMLYTYRDGRNDRDDLDYVKLKTINGNEVEMDPSAQLNCSIQYIDTGTFGVNNAFNLESSLLRNIDGQLLNHNDAITCIRPENILTREDGLKYCKNDPCPTGTEINSPILTSAGINACKILSNSPCPSKYCFRGIGFDEPIPDIYSGINTYYGTDEFYSLAGKRMHGSSTNIKSASCNSTYNNSNDIKVGAGNYSDKKFSECVLKNYYERNPYNRSSCDILNKKIRGVDTVHWGKFCIDNSNSDKVPMKHICETSGNNYVWKESKESNEWLGKCFDISDPTNPVPKTDLEICNMASPSNKYTPSSKSKCIITAPSTMSDSKIEGICENWEIDGLDSDNKFKYYNKPADVLSSHNVNRGGTCIIGDGRDNISTLGRSNKLECEYDNNKYHKKYTYDNSSFCPLNDVNYQVDRELTWTGGGASSDLNDNWTSTCSSSILDSCQVRCNDNYGGGGIYTCHYNNHSEDVCRHVEDTFNSISLEQTQRQNCEAHANCKYSVASPLSESKCTSIASPGDDLIKGQAEWLGNECYHLNNDAFSHGIYNLSTMNEYYPPLIRLIVFFILIIIVALLFRMAGLYTKTFNLGIRIANSGVRRTFTGFTKIMLDLFIGAKRVLMKPKTILVNISDFIIINYKKIIMGILCLAVMGIIVYVFFYDKLEFIFKGYNSSHIADSVENTNTDSSGSNNQFNNYKKYINVYYIVGSIVFIFIIRDILTR